MTPRRLAPRSAVAPRDKLLLVPRAGVRPPSGSCAELGIRRRIQHLGVINPSRGGGAEIVDQGNAAARSASSMVLRMASRRQR